VIQQTLRIVGAIAAKDIGDAIRNRTTLSVILGTLVLMLSSLAMPLLTNLDRRPTALVVDPGRSPVILALTTREDFRLRLARSDEEMRERLGGSTALALGLIIPPGFPDTTPDSGTVTLPGYVPHWASKDDVAALSVFFEARLTEAAGRPVAIDLVGNALYPSPTAFGGHTMAASASGVAILTVGLALAANLLTEENETRTLDALLVSPARYGHVVVAKTLTGLFYCGCAATVAFLVNARWFVHWGLALTATLLGAIFVVILGLLLGSLIGSSFNANMWMGLVALVVLVPGFAGSILGANTAPAVRAAMTWVPSGAMNVLLVHAMLGEIRIAAWGPPLARLTAGAGLIVALMVWRVRRVERHR